MDSCGNIYMGLRLYHMYVKPHRGKMTENKDDVAYMYWCSFYKDFDITFSHEKDSFSINICF